MSAVHHFNNPQADPGAPYPASARRVLSRENFNTAWRVITAWPGYQATPLHTLADLAADVGVGEIRLKDESARFGLGSFKALGGAYAVFRLLQAEIQRYTGYDNVTLDVLQRGLYQAIVAPLTVTCASAGNHGKSVAWGAQQFGCRCVIFVADNVASARVAGIQHYGAEVVRVAGTYDDAVRHADAEAARHGWHVVSDTSYEGYAAVPCDVMQGYTVMAEEIVHQWPVDSYPTHAFVQCGVGGLAAALCAHLWETWGAHRPRFVVVEPSAAACMYETARHGRPTRVDGSLETMMVCLACGEVSLLAWEILRHGADDFLTIPDVAEEEALARLHHGVGNDPPVRLGGSGAAGLAGLLVVAQDDDLRTALRIDRNSRVLLIGSEGGPHAQHHGSSGIGIPHTANCSHDMHCRLPGLCYGMRR